MRGGTTAKRKKDKENGRWLVLWKTFMRGYKGDTQQNTASEGNRHPQIYKGNEKRRPHKHQPQGATPNSRKKKKIQDYKRIYK